MRAEHGSLSEFFASQEKRRKQRHEGQLSEASVPSTPNPANIPVVTTGEDDLDLEEFNPEVHDYHQSAQGRQLTPVVEDPEAEAAEREAKTLRVASSHRLPITPNTSALSWRQSRNCALAAQDQVATQSRRRPERR